jgi:hypothetical protein
MYEVWNLNSTPPSTLLTIKKPPVVFSQGDDACRPFAGMTAMSGKLPYASWVEPDCRAERLKAVCAENGTFHVYQWLTRQDMFI